MTPLQAMLETVLAHLKESLLFAQPGQIDLRHDEKPHAVAGEIFVGIYPASLTEGPSGDPQMGIDQLIGINISVTQRTGFCPDDRMLREAALHPKIGCMTVAMAIVRALRIRRLRIPYDANLRLASPWSGNFLYEPLKLSGSAITVRAVGPEHFHAEPDPLRQNPQVYGLLSVLPFTGARYMENVITQTQATLA